MTGATGPTWTGEPTWTGGPTWTGEPTWTSEPSGPAWDLDAPAPTPPPAGRTGPGPVLLLAIGLAGLALGSLTGSLLAPAAAPVFPPSATLSPRDLYVDGAVPEPVIVLRLQVDNPGTAPVQLSRLTVSGVARSPNVLPLDLQVPGGRSAVVDVPVRPDCPVGGEPTGVRARLSLTGLGGPARREVSVSPSRALTPAGAVCGLFDAEMPRGWRTPLAAVKTRLDGRDLEITIRDLSAERLAGILVDDQLLPTVFVGDQLLSSTARLRPGEPTELRLRGPPPCVQSSGIAPMPSTLRLLALTDQGLQQRLVIVGPELSRWLQLDCGHR